MKIVFITTLTDIELESLSQAKRPMLSELNAIPVAWSNQEYFSSSFERVFYIYIYIYICNLQSALDLPASISFPASLHQWREALRKVSVLAQKTMQGCWLDVNLDYLIQMFGLSWLRPI